MPDIQDAYERYGDRVAFVGVQQTSLNTPEEGREFLDELGITYPNFGDQGGTVQFSYGVLNYPTTYFLDSDHNINRTWMGLISKNNLEAQIEAINES
jgi:peroxiredoxin